MGGGASGTARPPRSDRNFVESRAIIACADSSGLVRSSNGFSDTIRKAAFGWE